jgi:hypothetical protein
VVLVAALVVCGARVVVGVTLIVEVVTSFVVVVGMVLGTCVVSQGPTELASFLSTALATEHRGPSVPDDTTKSIVFFRSAASSQLAPASVAFNIALSNALSMILFVVFVVSGDATSGI